MQALRKAIAHFVIGFLNTEGQFGGLDKDNRLHVAPQPLVFVAWNAEVEGLKAIE